MSGALLNSLRVRWLRCRDQIGESSLDAHQCRFWSRDPKVEGKLRSNKLRHQRCQTSVHSAAELHNKITHELSRRVFASAKGRGGSASGHEAMKR